MRLDHWTIQRNPHWVTPTWRGGGSKLHAVHLENNMRFRPSIVLLSLPWISECADREDIIPRKGTVAFDGSYFGFIPSAIGPRLQNSLRTLYLHRGEVSRSLPTQIGMLTGLTGIVILENDMDGSLPTEVGALTQMADSFEIRGNHFSGEIPFEYGSLNALTGSFVIDQKLDGDGTVGGTIPPELSGLTQLQESFVLHGLHSSGSLPSELFALSLLTGQFQIASSDIEGPLPTEVGLLTAVKEILLNGNHFSGSIPTEVGSLTNLERGLVLSQNAFTGTVPTQLGKLSQLKTYFDLGDNSLIGSMPTELGKLASLEYGFILRGNAYLDTVAIPPEVAALSSSMHEQIKKLGGYDDGHAFEIENPVERVRGGRELLSAPSLLRPWFRKPWRRGSASRIRWTCSTTLRRGAERMLRPRPGPAPGICECYRRGNNDFAWMLNDCSMRTCPKYVPVRAFR